YKRGFSRSSISPSPTCLSPHPTLFVAPSLRFRSGRLLVEVPLLWQDTPTSGMRDHRALTILNRGLRLLCPRCGRAPLFRGFFTMHERCGVCGLVFEREQGYFVGAIYVNYAATVGITVAGFLLLDSYSDLSIGTQIVLWSVFGITFPLFFFRYSRSLCLSIDYVFNPDAAA